MAFVLDNLLHVLGPHHPALVVLWLAAALGLAILLVYACGRISRALQ